MTAWPKVPSLQRPPRLLDDDEPLSCVPFQGPLPSLLPSRSSHLYFPIEHGQPLLSTWPNNQTVVVGRPPPRVPQGVLDSMRVSDFVGFAPSTGVTVRNQVFFFLIGILKILSIILLFYFVLFVVKIGCFNFAFHGTNSQNLGEQRRPEPFTLNL